MYNGIPYYIIFRAMVLSVLAILFVGFFTGTLVLVGVAYSVLTGKPGGDPTPLWVGAGITYVLTIIVACKFIPALKKQKKREDWDDLSKGL